MLKTLSKDIRFDLFVLLLCCLYRAANKKKKEPFYLSAKA